MNWRNLAVEQAMFAAMRFWLDCGVAGFRLDAITTLFEDPQLRNEGETGGLNAQNDPNLDDRIGANENVLECLRHADGAKDVLVMMNMSAAPQVLSLDLQKQSPPTRFYTLAASDEAVHLKNNQVTLPPFSVWIGESR